MMYNDIDYLGYFDVLKSDREMENNFDKNTDINVNNDANNANRDGDFQLKK